MKNHCAEKGELYIEIKIERGGREARKEIIQWEKCYQRASKKHIQKGRKESVIQKGEGIFQKEKQEKVRNKGE